MSEAVKDIALTEDADGKGVLMHRADCPYARMAAANGLPVATLFGIQGGLPTDIKRHDCLEVKP